MATGFGPMPACATMGDPEGPEPRSLAGLRAALFEGGGPVRVEGTAALVPGRARGPLTGGNLTLLAALCGTPYALRAEGRIVLLEDIREQPYRIDRMLTQLLQAGCLAGAAGVALGSWVECGDALPVLAERLAPLGVPVIAGLPIGHGSPQLTVWFGAEATIDAESCSMTSLFRDPVTAP